MDVELLGTRPFEIRTRFELAAARMADVWIRAGRVSVSAEDFRILREYLERDGWVVEELPGVRVRLRHRGFHSEEMTRERAALVAFRRLVLPTEPHREVLPATADAPAAPLTIAIEISAPARTFAAACRVISPA